MTYEMVLMEHSPKPLLPFHESLHYQRPSSVPRAGTTTVGILSMLQLHCLHHRWPLALRRGQQMTPPSLHDSPVMS